MSDLKKEIQELEMAMKAAEKDAVRNSVETMNVVSSRGRDYYSLRNKNTKQRKIVRMDDPKVAKCAQSAYAKAFLVVAKRVFEDMNQDSKEDYRKELCNVFEKLHPARKAIVNPYILSREQFAEQWQKQTWNNKNSYEITGDFKTLKGEKVRSKSEQIIANLLYHAGIPYLYEKPLVLSNEQVRYPDFTILNKRTGKVYILEHFGRMDDPDYRAKAWKKIFEYGNSGFVLGDNFLFTFEEGTVPFHSELLNLYIQTMFQ